MSILSTGKLFLDALASEIYYDPVVKRYRYKASDVPGAPIKGFFVSREKALQLQRTYLEKSIKEFVALSPRIKAGEIGVYKESAELLKRIHVSNAIIAAGGIDKINNSELGTIGNILKKQYYQGKDFETGKPFGLKHMFADVAADPDYSVAKLTQRLGMYAQSGEITYETIRQSKQIEIGLTEMKRVLGATHDHCSPCLGYASAGWQPIGELPLPKTACTCRMNCKCNVLYR